MEPNYRGKNGRIDAMAAAWLLANDHVFFRDDDIAWDGQRHSITGIQLNTATVDQLPMLTSDSEPVLRGVIDLMQTLENDASLHVARNVIRPALYDSIREGDLTGITLFNLMACGRAIEITQIDDLTYQVNCDERLVQGIPGFYELVAQMVADMLMYNGASGECQVSCASIRSSAADCYMDDVEVPVSGFAQGHGWEGCVNLSPNGGQPSVLAQNATDVNLDERGFAGLLEDTLNALNDLGNALAEEMGVSPEEFKGMVDAAGKTAWTFNEGKSAKGRRFTVGLPDQFAAVDDCNGRPLAVPVEDYAQGGDDGYMESPQIIYSGLIGDFDEEAQATYRTNMLPELRVQMSRHAIYGNQVASAIGSVVDDWVVKGKNCLVLVYDLQQKSFMPGFLPDCHEYYVKPIVYDHEDMLRVTDSFTKLAPGELKELALEVAKTVEVDKPVELQRLTQLTSYLTSMPTIEEFTELINAVGNVLVMAGSSRMNADLWRVLNRAGDDKSSVIDTLPRVRASAFNGSLQERVRYYTSFVDILEAQKRLGNPDFKAMWLLVGEVFDQLIVDHIEIEDDEEATQETNATGIISIPDNYAAIHDRWIALAPDGANPAATQARM